MVTNNTFREEEKNMDPRLHELANDAHFSDSLQVVHFRFFAM